MTNYYFTEEDQKKVAEYLNSVAKNAKFNLSTTELIEYFKLLSYMQQQILPKINANILEVKKVVEAKKEEKTPKKKK